MPSAVQAGSTNIAGFADGWDDIPGWGWYDRKANPDGALKPGMPADVSLEATP